MKKQLIILLIIFLAGILYYGELRNFICWNNKDCVTVWRTYDNVCYVIYGRYYGLFSPSLEDTYIKTTNTADGVNLFRVNSNLIIAQIDDNALIHNSKLSRIKIVNYNADLARNDSVYTYVDNNMKIRRFKKNIKVLSIQINKTGAL